MAIGWPEEVSIPADVHTLANFLRWVQSPEYPERGNIAFVSGEIFLDMSPERIEANAKVKGEIYLALCQLARDSDCGEVFPDGVMVVNEAAGLACEPDVTYCSWNSQQSGRVRYGKPGTDSNAALALHGSPDLVVEVLSHSSVRKDTVALFEGYYAAGIDEYWLVDARGEQIEFDIFTRGADGYVPVAADAEGYRRSGVFDLAFALTRSANRAGGADYRLLSR